MKSTSILLTLFTSISLFSQQIPTPDYAARPYILKSNNTLENLERTDANSDIKVKGLGYGGMDMYYAAFGDHSIVRFAQGSLPRLVIKLDENVDPEESVTLSKAEVKKDRRRFLQSSRKMMGAARNTGQEAIKLTFKPIRTGVFEIVLPSNLEVGEYAFMPMMAQQTNMLSTNSIKIACFGIDAGITSTASSEFKAETPVASVQNPSTAIIYPAPDFDNLVYFYNARENTLDDLERAVNAKSEGAFGFLNLNSSVSITGQSSPIKIAANDKNSFVVRLADATDPYTIVELVPCEPNTEKQTRDYNPSAKKGQPATTAIAVKFKRINGNMYLITTLQPLAKGTYFFINKSLKEKSIFAFEIVG